MALAVDTVAGVPGAYRQAAMRAVGFPRARTDVAGFVGVGGPNRLGEVVRIEDWRSYEQTYLRDAKGALIAPPAGSRLAECVRAYFTNGGSRCWIANIGDRIEASQAGALLDTMLGLTSATGLEALLMVREVAIVGLPELDAWIPTPQSTTFTAPVACSDRFRSCPSLRVVPPLTTASNTDVGPLCQPADLIFAQRYLIERCGRVKWRAFAIVNPPAGTSPAQATAWRDALTKNLADADAAAIYWPWVEAQDKPGAPVELRPPLGYVAGVYARRDLGRGPHVAPANESLLGVVGVETEIDDPTHGAIYADGVNVLRPFANVGVQVWGARTLLWSGPDGDPLGWVNVRRCLSAIERTADVIGQGVVFEPNLPVTRFKLSQALFAYLLELQNAGAFQGATPDESFFVRCDASNNPDAQVALGQLLCEVGVAIAAPAEFIIFRVGRNEGVVEIEEQT
jgi:hypothetical protein